MAPLTNPAATAAFTSEKAQVDVAGLINDLKALEIRSIDEVEAEQAAFINAGRLRDRMQSEEKDLRAAEELLSAAGAGGSGKGHSVEASERVVREMAVCEEQLAAKRAEMDKLKERSSVVNDDLAVVQLANRSPSRIDLAADKGDFAVDILSKFKAHDESQLTSLQSEIDGIEQRKKRLQQQLRVGRPPRALARRDRRPTPTRGGPHKPRVNHGRSSSPWALLLCNAATSRTFATTATAGLP